MISADIIAICIIISLVIFAIKVVVTFFTS